MTASTIRSDNCKHIHAKRGKEARMRGEITASFLELRMHDGWKPYDVFTDWSDNVFM